MLLYSERIWQITSFDHQAAIMESIRNTENFFRCLGVKTRLSEYGIGAEVIGKVMDQLAGHGTQMLGGAGDLSIDDVPAILGSRI